MEEIKRQVKRARRRMVLQQFLTIVGWSLFATLLVGAIGLAIPKIWVLTGIDREAWKWTWIGGSIASGLLMAGVWTYLIRRSALEAAIEIDRRFGLKERVSSTLALEPEELNSDIGKALMQDAVRRVERIDVREQFKVSPSWRNVLPILPAIALVLLPLLPDAATKKAEASASAKANEQKQVKKSFQKLVEQKRGEAQKADPTKLEQSDFQKMIDQKIDKLINKEGLDRKNAMIELNKLANEIDKRKQQLGGAEKMKQELEKLTKLEKGPADKLADAMKEGDFQAAQKELQKLQEKLQAGELSKDDEKALAKQAEKIKERIEEKMEQHKQARADLQKQIEQKMQQGDVAGAEKLQQKLDQMNQEADQLEQKMGKMAENLDQLAKAMQEGGKEGQQKAADQLGKIAQDLKAMEKDLQEMENLDELMDQLADAKEAMKCEQCDGAGCKACQGNGNKMADGDGEDGKDGKKNSKMAGKGKTGKGRGQGERDEEETDTKAYDTRVAGDPKKGESVRIGDAEGKNAKGKVSIEIIKNEIATDVGNDADASDDTALSRDLKKHAREYFDKFRKGELPE
jgi:hypothetical protein